MESENSGSSEEDEMMDVQGSNQIPNAGGEAGSRRGNQMQYDADQMDDDAEDDEGEGMGDQMDIDALAMADEDDNQPSAGWSGGQQQLTSQMEIQAMRMAAAGNRERMPQIREGDDMYGMDFDLDQIQNQVDGEDDWAENDDEMDDWEEEDNYAKDRRF